MIPALSQSRYEQMACPHSYLIQINGAQMPESLVSHRGTQVHTVMARYVEHCAAEGIPADWEYFDHCAQAVGTEAGSILDGLRDNYTVQHEHVFKCETRLMLDDDFQPTKTDEDGVEHDAVFPGLETSKKMAAYAGTLDVILTSDRHGAAKIEDYKSHFRPFDPDTFQSKLYPVLLFQHMPHIDSITFELIFVRYKNVRRKVKFTRDQLPALMKEVERARHRQVEYHETQDAGGEVSVLPGDHCQYCPLLANLQCPIREWNPHANVSAEERMRFNIWAGKAQAVNSEVIKAYVSANDKLSVKDANGNEYVADFHEKESQVFPALQTVAACMEWNDEMGGIEKAFLASLEIKSTTIKGKLETKKRRPLFEKMLGTGIIERRTKVSFGLKSLTSGNLQDGAPAYSSEEF